MQDGTVLDEKELASLSLVDAVVHHASLAQRPSQTKVESTGVQQTSSDVDRSTEEDTVPGIKRENAGRVTVYTCITKRVSLCDI